MINEALNSKKDTDPPKHILKDDNEIEDPAEMAEVFNDCFANIGPNLANNIPDSTIEFHKFLNDRNPQSLFFAPVVEEEIKDIVNNLNTHKKVQDTMHGITNFLLKKYSQWNNFSFNTHTKFILN